MADRAHYVGHSHFFDTGTRMIFSNGFEWLVSGDQAQVVITDPKHPRTGIPLNLRHPMQVWTVKTIMAMMVDMHGVTVEPLKREFAGIVCPDCDGHGGNDDLEGNWVTCPTCGEDGMI